MTVKSTENYIWWCVYTFLKLLFRIKVSSFGSKGHWVLKVLTASKFLKFLTTFYGFWLTAKLYGTLGQTEFDENAVKRP